MGVIAQLPVDVVNQIAAGEVIVRPANAVKELIENSLDAGATEIVVTIVDGGLSLLQVQDNGSGILKDDLVLVCERFATSKLRVAEDLLSMRTFGFRGEALASISQVANVSITTKTRDSACAVQAKYQQGKLVGEIRSSAGVDGTTVTVESLFESLPSRRNTFKATDETNRVTDAVMRYAVLRPFALSSFLHSFSEISFAVRRGGADFRTSGRGDRAEVVRQLFGKKVTEELVPLTLVTTKFSMEGVFSRPVPAATAHSIQAKKGEKTFMFFVNGRAVESQRLRTALHFVFGAAQLHCHFLMTSLTVDMSSVDVNVHPTKETVLINGEEEIFSAIADRMVQKSAIRERPVTVEMKSYAGRSQTASTATDSRDASSLKVYDHQLVRTNTTERRLDEFFNRGDIAEPVLLVPVSAEEDDAVDTVAATQRRFCFTSLDNLRRTMCSRCSPGLRGLFKHSSFVGTIDVTRLLLQHSTGLYLVDLSKALAELFYQVCITSFGNFGSFKLGAEGAPLLDLLRAGLGDELDDDEKRQCVAFIESNARMLEDYFSIVVRNSEGKGEDSCILVSIPSLFADFVPQLEGLPSFMVALVRDVNWDQEETCFDGICRCIANFFTPSQEFCCEDLLSGVGVRQQWRAVVRDVLYPQLKTRLLPPADWNELNTVVKRLVDLHDLYKVFERC